MLNNSQIDLASQFSEDDIGRVVEQELPDWKNACQTQDAETVILTQKAFGQSAKELLLLGAAIKYAGKAHKNVTVVLQE